MEAMPTRLLGAFTLLAWMTACVDTSDPAETMDAVMSDDDTSTADDDTSTADDDTSTADDDTSTADDDTSTTDDDSAGEPSLCDGNTGGGEFISDNCSENFTLPNCNISDFTADTYDNGNWGDAMSLTGDSFGYTGEGDELTRTLGDGFLSVQGEVLDYAGWGFAFGPCVDGSVFDGLQITIQGDLGEGGQLAVQVQSDENYPMDGDRGACEFEDDSTKWSDCSNNQAIVTGVNPDEALTYYIPWGEFKGGKPNAELSSNQLWGMQFQVNCGDADTICETDLKIHDLRFYREHEAYLGPVEEPVTD